LGDLDLALLGDLDLALDTFSDLSFGPFFAFSLFAFEDFAPDALGVLSACAFFGLSSKRVFRCLSSSPRSFTGVAWSPPLLLLTVFSLSPFRLFRSVGPLDLDLSLVKDGLVGF